MKKFIYYSLPGYGHINPTVNVARELVKQGHRVIYYSTPRFKTIIEDAGIIFRDYEFKNIPDGNTSRNVGLFIDGIADIVTKQLPFLVDAAKRENPDCIIHDCMAVWGKIIAQNLHVPAVSLITSAAYNKKSFLPYPKLYVKFLLKFLLGGNYFISAYRKYKSVAKQYGAKLTNIVDIMISREELNIVFALDLFHPFHESFDSTFHFVGPSLSPRKETSSFVRNLSKNKKIIYISYGTVINDDRAFFTSCINAFGNTPYQVIISLGDRFDPSDFPNPPTNIVIKKYVNQLEILEKTSVFVTHAGMNSCMEGLFYGVRMLLIPDTEEQRFNALRIRKMGVGIFMKKRHTNEQLLRKHVEKLLSDPSYKRNAEVVQKTIKKAGGYQAAVKQILSYLG